MGFGLVEEVGGLGDGVPGALAADGRAGMADGVVEAGSPFVDEHWTSMCRHSDLCGVGSKRQNPAEGIGRVLRLVWMEWAGMPRFGLGSARTEKRGLCQMLMAQEGGRLQEDRGWTTETGAGAWRQQAPSVCKASIH